MEFARENILLIAIALMSGGMLLWPFLRNGVGGSQVDTNQATQMINRQDALLLDVRELAEWNQGRVLGARHVPAGELEARAGEVSKKKDKPVIVYCESGTRASSAAGVLRKHGYTNVFSLAGGFTGWRHAGLPVEK
ncbi:MAG: rhodanese-like domain-containing protein [Proteobacteria bacterium]|nr:rhodanese-like domain-containing protein [Pseudomonadota bacterium]